jgi:ATP-binding protein involved in chromosome partitioning
MTDQELLAALSGVVHPESGRDIVSSGIVEDVAVTPEGVRFTLHFPRARDPFLRSIRRAAEQAVLERFPEYAGRLSIGLKEAAPKKIEKPGRATATGAIRNIVAVSSAKGGVGKSTVAANLAVALARAGYRVGIMDADIYGPSLPLMFGLEDYRPPAEEVDGRELILPGESHGVAVMSIGFFVEPHNALIWRGAMATSALRQLIHQTRWGELDYLLIDMPPGTGDIHLTLVQELAVSGVLMVTTPQRVALADAVRGIAMYRTEGIGVPVLGLVENMAWFTPAELPDNRYYIFGRAGAGALARAQGIPLLGEIPLVQAVAEGGDTGRPVAGRDSIVGEAFRGLAARLVERLEQRSAERPATKKGGD